MSPQWRNTLVVCGLAEDSVVLSPKSQEPMPLELFGVFDVDELAKCYTGDELVVHPPAR